MTSKRKTIFSTILLFLVLLFFPPVLLAEITITAIDVGQGGAVLVQNQAYRVLIDGGGQPVTVSDYLTPAPGDSPQFYHLI